MHCLRQIGYMGLNWFSLGLAIDILQAWKGNIFSDPLPLISSERMKVSEIWCQLSTVGITETLSFLEHYKLAE